MSADLPPLFELAEQTSQRPKRRTETQVAFYDRIDDEAIGRVRAVIEAWFEGYAANDSKEAFKLRQRLRSGRNDDFMAAVWELYLHETFVRLGFGVTVEPAVDGGEIDFYIERASTRLYVEATTLLRPAVSGAELAPGYAPALDAVDDAFHPDFGLMVRGFVPGRGNPPLKKLTAAAEGLMSQFDWEDLRGSRSIDMTERVLEVDGWTLHVVVWPRPAADRGCRDYATVLMEPSLGGVSHAREAILRKLRAKAQKYKNLDAPFVVAINSFAMRRTSSKRFTAPRSTPSTPSTRTPESSAASRMAFGSAGRRSLSRGCPLSLLPHSSISMSSGRLGPVSGRTRGRPTRLTPMRFRGRGVSATWSETRSNASTPQSTPVGSSGCRPTGPVKRSRLNIVGVPNEGKSASSADPPALHEALLARSTTARDARHSAIGAPLKVVKGFADQSQDE